MNDEFTCESCYYYVETVRKSPNKEPVIFRQCRRYPPQVVAIPQTLAPNIRQPGPQQIQVTPVSTYPSVTSSDTGCGEHSLRRANNEN